jgi:hypothetical protein
MKPFSVALWIAKFVASLTLLLVVIPGAAFYGGTYAITSYQNRREINAKECSEGRRELEIAKQSPPNIVGVPEGRLGFPGAA